MERLTYSPKCFAFVRSFKDGKIRDISDDVISGTIDRLINQPSTASLVLRNPDFKYCPRGGRPLFELNDMITIWLQRIPGKPIQVFTGFLDTGPFYQMYPGNCTLTATCTLKRLLHRYFDPGVQEMFHWFATKGWIEDPSTGNVTEPSDMWKTVGASKGASSDGGFGHLLRMFLIEICGWNPDGIWISDLPHDLPAQANRLYKAIKQDSQDAEDSFNAMLGAIMSVKVPANQGGKEPQSTALARTIKGVADRLGVPVDVCLVAALVRTNMQETHQQGNPAKEGFGFGLYAFPDSRGEILGKYTLSEVLGAQRATEIFCLRIKQLNGGDNSKRGDIDLSNVSPAADLILRACGADPSNQAIKAVMTKGITTNIPVAAKLLSAADITVASTSQQPGPDPDLTNITWESVFTQPNSPNARARASTYNSTGKDLAPFAKIANVNGLLLDTDPSHLKTMQQVALDLTKNLVVTDTAKGTSPTLATYAKWAGSNTKGTGIEVMQGTKLWRDGKLGSVTRIEDRGASQTSVYITFNGATQFATPIVPPSDSSGLSFPGAVVTTTAPDNTTDPTSGVLSWDDFAKTTFASAFASQFAFPINLIESQVLSGKKALMNDIPVMEGVSQMAGGSMRNFCSAPNGEFLAFYPDYFGAHIVDGKRQRQAYWDIKDIEIMNMGIQMSDAKTPTHVYVVGGTFQAMSIDEVSQIQAIESQGVVTILDIFEGANFIVGDEHTALKGAFDAAKFLQQFGARPVTVKNPVIRSHWFEFLYAWQLFMYLWAAQYNTVVEMTFQPEIMAGGRISFSNHNLEMYVEQVTHTFDYTTGFMTQCVLSAPAVMDLSKGSYPGMVVAGEAGFSVAMPVSGVG